MVLSWKLLRPSRRYVFLDTFTIPYVWGGDFNRPPSQLIEESHQSGLGLVAFVPPGEHITCSNGGLIDYFFSHVGETDILQEVRKVKGAPITPHYPVE